MMRLRKYVLADKPIADFARRVFHNIFGVQLKRIESVIHPAVYLASFVAYTALRLVNFNALGEIRSFPDTPVYLKLASRSLFDIVFWVGPRPWNTPLVFKLLGNDPPSIGVFQLTFSIV